MRILLALFSVLVFSVTAFAEGSIDLEKNYGFSVGAPDIFEIFGRIGAEVWKKENAGKGDFGRSLTVGLEGRLSGPNKPSIGLYLKIPVTENFYTVGALAYGKNYRDDNERNYLSRSLGAGYDLKDYQKGAFIEGRVGSVKAESMNSTTDTKPLYSINAGLAF